MSLEAAVPILHAGGSGYFGRFDAKLETPSSLGDTLSDQAAFSRDALLAPNVEGP